MRDSVTCWLLKTAAVLALAAAAAVGLGLVADDASASRAPKIHLRDSDMRLGFHSPDWRVWARCTTTVYVTVGVDGVVLAETPGEKECPAEMSWAKRRGLRG